MNELLSQRFIFVIKQLAILLLCSFGMALFLELCTLIGARLSSPFSISDWNSFRVSVFFLLCFILLSFIDFCIATKRMQPLPILFRSCVRCFSFSSIWIVSVSLLPGIMLGAGYAIIATLLHIAFDYRIAGALICLGTLLSILVRYRAELCEHIEYGFLALSISFGLTFCIMMPVIPSVSYDGQIHFDNAVAESFICEAEYSGADQIMANGSSAELLEMVESGDLAGHWNPSQELDVVSAANNTLLDKDNESILVMDGTDGLYVGSWISRGAIGYIPCSIGLWLGRLLHLPCLGQYFFARVSSLLFYCVVFFAAIKQLGSGKLIVATLGLLPTPLLMACNFSYDPWMYSWIVFAFSRYVGSMQRNNGVVPTFDVVTALVAFGLGAIIKPVVFPLALIFITPVSKPTGASSRFSAVQIVSILLALCLMLSFVVPFVISGGTAGTDPRGGASVSSGGQVAYIISQPLAFLSTLLSFSIQFLSVDSLLFSDGNFLSGFPYLALEFNRFAIVALLELLLLIAVSLFDHSDRNCSTYRTMKMKTATVIGIILSYALIVIAMYAAITPVGSDYIAGVQQRYLLPLLPPLCLLLMNTKAGSQAQCSLYLRKAFLPIQTMLLAVSTYMMFIVAF